MGYMEGRILTFFRSGLDTADIAAGLRMTEAAVYRYLSRARNIETVGGVYAFRRRRAAA